MAPRRSSAAARIQPAVRCAIYTRKSTDEGLDRDFNSLDNQRERAEAYIASQEGWTALPDRYDDGGFSGGTTDRPGLKRLLGDVETGLVDTILVYRLDRLSRSLVDFGRIHELLDEHGVALVSVTESINTTSPHGRMMINVLLSFAQYERELVAERTRDKIQAARRRGKWTGGMPPLGYDVAPEGGRLIVNKSEADQVRAIFGMYLEAPSLVGVAQELNRRGWRRKSWTTKTGKHRQGGAWDRVSLSRMLKDPIYVGRQKLGDEVFPGEHDGIVTKKLFDQVQKLIGRNHRTRGATARNKHGFLLRGLLRCAACDSAMAAAPSKARGRLHRYYRCCRGQKQGHASCPTKSVKADKIEAFVIDQIRRIGADRDLHDKTFREAERQLKARRRGLKLESKRLVDDSGRARTEVERLVATVSRLEGPAESAVAVELAKAQEHLQTLEARQAEVAAELAAVKAQSVDRDELARALVEFDELWSVLLTPERERILQSLIGRISYDGGTGELTITWRLAGFGELAAEVAS